METTLTTDNLVSIIRAMQKINLSDRTESFNDYYREISKAWIEQELSKVIEQSENSQETDRDRQQFTPGEGRP
jgi:hypothetical protein